jgi:hypothetical protein
MSLTADASVMYYQWKQLRKVVDDSALAGATYLLPQNATRTPADSGHQYRTGLNMRTSRSDWRRSRCRTACEVNSFSATGSGKRSSTLSDCSRR